MIYLLLLLTILPLSSSSIQTQLTVGVWDTRGSSEGVLLSYNAAFRATSDVLYHTEGEDITFALHSYTNATEIFSLVALEYFDLLIVSCLHV